MTLLTRLTTIAGLGLAMCAAGAFAAEPLPTAEQFQAWGEESLTLIDREFWLEDRGLYAEKIPLASRDRDESSDGRRGPQTKLEPAFMWSAGVQLSALNAAAKLNPDKFTSRLTEYADALQLYWKEHNGVAGFDVLPAPAEPDRYYDDNAWIVLGLLELYELTGETRWLDRAEATLNFVFSGEDDQLGGGLYWREKEKTSKNTCTNAPAIVAALRLERHRKTGQWRRAAERTRDWTAGRLQDADGLYLDNVALDGKVDRRKFTYNTALMIRANVLFYEQTGERRWLDEAQRLALAAETHWIDPETGAIRDGGRFAHLLVDSLLALYEADRDRHWLETSQRALAHLHQQRDAAGFYPSRWDGRRGRPSREAMLLDQASAARGLLAVAAAMRRQPAEPTP